MNQTVLLGDVTTFLARGSAPKYTESDDFFVINQKCIRDWRVSLEQARFTDTQAKKVSEDRQLKANDILVNSTGQGTLGRVGQFYGSEKPATVDSHITIVRANPELVDPIFLGYALKGREKEIELLAEGSTGQTELSRLKLANLQLSLPTLEKQKESANILRVVDEKIELSWKMNETLEQMGRSLFRHYFINNPEMEKWGSTTFSDFVDHIKTAVSPFKTPDTIFHQYSIPGYDNSFTPEVSPGDTIKSGKYRVEANSILVSKLNPATPRIWAVLEPLENAVCSTEFQVIVPKKYYAFCYFLLTSKAYTNKMAMSAGGTSNSHRRIKPGDILSYTLAKPNSEWLDSFEQQSASLLKAIDKNREQSQTLTALRNALLPRLVSGASGVK